MYLIKSLLTVILRQAEEYVSLMCYVQGFQYWVGKKRHFIIVDIPLEDKLSVNIMLEFPEGLAL